MATKISRFFQSIWAGNYAGSPTGVLAKVGSLTAGSPGYSGDPLQLQTAFTAWLSGIQATFAPGGQQSPAYQDWNSILYVITTQLAYILQQGVPEWDSTTVYFTGSMVNVGGSVWVSLLDNNLNNPVVAGSWWRSIISPQMRAQAFINCDSTSGSVVRSAYNCSMTKNGVGDITINFDGHFSSPNVFTAVASCGDGSLAFGCKEYSRGANYISYNIYGNAGLINTGNNVKFLYEDSASIMVIVHAVEDMVIP